VVNITIINDVGTDPSWPGCWSGAAIMARDLATALAKRGNSIRFYSILTAVVPGCEVRGLRKLKAVGEEEQGFAELELRALAFREARNWADVILSHGPLTVAYEWLTNIPMVNVTHHPRVEEHRALYLDHPRVVQVLLSEAHWKDWDLPSAFLIRNGVDVSRTLPHWESKRVGLAVWAGRVAPYKGLHTAISACELAGVELRAMGMPFVDSLPYFAEQMARMDGENLRWCGAVDQEVTLEAMSRATMFLMPIEWEEPGSLALLEAMGCGCTPIVYARGVVPEVVQDGVNGYIVDSAKGMAEAMRKPLLGAEARETVLKHFTTERQAEDFERLFENLATCWGEYL
jgi:glycosyltransferase involved in cell wall biosynthesis